MLPVALAGILTVIVALALCSTISGTITSIVGVILSTVNDSVLLVDGLYFSLPLYVAVIGYVLAPNLLVVIVAIPPVWTLAL